MYKNRRIYGDFFCAVIRKHFNKQKLQKVIYLFSKNTLTSLVHFCLYLIR